MNHLDLADPRSWNPLLSLTSWLFPLTLGEADFVSWLFVEKFSNLAFPVWFARWQFPCHRTWSLGLKYSQHVNALQAVTVAVTSPPSNFLLFWSRGGGATGSSVEGRYSWQQQKCSFRRDNCQTEGFGKFAKFICSLNKWKFRVCTGCQTHRTDAWDAYLPSHGSYGLTSVMKTF